MRGLHNKLSAAQRAQIIEENKEDRIVLSLYRYTNIKQPDFFRDYLFIHWNKFQVLGRIYVAHEGINAQLSVPKNNFSAFKNFLQQITYLENIRLNIGHKQESKSFLKLTIKVKNKIVADGIDDPSFDSSNIGKHLNAKEFNDYIQDENTVCVDMRNHYESEIGHFETALTPDVDTFRDSLPVVKELLEDKKDKNIVMYCTGGIRCEKASAYLKHNGFEHVFQLEGGIIEYAKQINEDNIDNKFLGKNFVFDHRLSEPIDNTIISKCHQCGAPADTHVNCVNEACHLLFIQCEACQKKMKNCCSKSCIEIINLPLEEQKKLRKNKRNSNKKFKKGRFSSLKIK